MGGSSKPEDPKVTPYQEPAAPKNPVPNWFSGGGQASTFTPDFSQSAKPFGNPVAQPAPQPMAQPAMQQPMQPMTGGMGNYSQPMQQPSAQGQQERFTPFSIPSMPARGYGNPFMADGNFGPMFGGQMGNPFGGPDMRANMERMASPEGQQGFYDRIMGMFKGGINGLQNAPRLQNLMGSFNAPAPTWSQYGQVPERQEYNQTDVYGVRPGVDRRA